MTMILSDENITRFQTIYKNKFGIDISREDAYEKGVRLLRLVSLTYRPMTQAQLDVVQARRKELFGNKDP